MNVQRLRGHLAMARISNSPTVVTNVLAGAAIAGGLTTGNIQTIVLLSISLIAFYTAGMYLNDLCDYEVDKRERAERPLIIGTVSKGEAWVITIGLFAIGLGILLFIKPALLISGIVLTGLIILYDVWHKGNVFSPIIMGANRFMVYVIAFLAFVPHITWTVIIPAAFLWAYILGVTLIAKSENTGSFTQYYPIIVLLAPTVYAIATLQPAAWLMSAIFITWVLYCAMLIYRRKAIKQAVGSLLAGICLLDGLVLSSIIGFVGIIIAVASLIVTIVFQLYIKGT